MRIMVMESRSVTRRLISALAGSDFELGCPSELLEAVILLKRNQFDLVVMDSSTEGAEATCHRVSEAGSVPVVLMIGQKQQNWKKMQSLDVDGYIPQGVNGAELVARLRAVLRRFCPTEQVEKMNPVPEHLKILTKS